jgi:Zn-finger nucleic acid-binding protein
LDKIIERGSATAPQQPQQPAPPQYQSHPQQHPQQHYEHQKPYYKKRESFLSDLFDF